MCSQVENISETGERIKYLQNKSNSDARTISKQSYLGKRVSLTFHRSFGSGNDDKEEKRAQELIPMLQYLKEK